MSKLNKIRLDGIEYALGGITEIPIATTEILGGIKPDGTTITVNTTTGVASVIGGGGTPYVLPTMSASTKGGARLGTGLTITDTDKLGVDSDNLDLSNNTSITTLTTSVNNIIDGTTEIDISENETITKIVDGTTPVPSSYALPTMASDTKGGAKVGSGLSVDNDTLSVDTSVIATNERVTTIRESLNDVIGTEAPTGTTPINFVTLNGEQPPTEEHPEYDHYGYFVCNDKFKGYCLTEMWWKNNGLDNLDFRVVLGSSRTSNPPLLAFKCTRTSSSSNNISVLLKTYNTSGTLLVSETITITPSNYNDYNYTDYYVAVSTYTGSPLWLASGDLMVGVGDGCSSILPVTISVGRTSTKVTLKPNSFAYTINGFVPLAPYQLLTNTVSDIVDGTQNITYDNTISGLSADTIKEAIDELEMTKLSSIPIATTSVLGGIKPDGTTITVDENGVATASGHTYSTDEQVVGTWIDGKPVYEKTFIATNLSTHETLIDFSNLNCKKLISVDGWLVLTTLASIPVNCYNGGSYSNTLFIDNYLHVNTGGGWAYVEYYVTVRYTKTTD